MTHISNSIFFWPKQFRLVIPTVSSDFFKLIKQKILILVILISVICNSNANAQVQAIMADKVVDMFGVNTHFNYEGTRYTNLYFQVRDRLTSLGVRHIRDFAVSNPAYNAKINELGGFGIKFDLICDIRYGWAPDWAGSLANVKTLMNLSNHPVEMIEAPNEMDGAKYLTIEEKQKRSRDFYTTFKSDPQTKNLPLLGPSPARTIAPFSAYGDLSGYMDFGNMHCYPGGAYVEGPQGGGWGKSLDTAITCYNRVSGSKPAYATETGYQNPKPGHRNTPVTERACAKYTPRAIFYYIKKGIRSYFQYEMINSSDEENFGLLNDDASPRKHYLAVQNLISLFKDPGSPFVTSSLDYTITGQTSNIFHSLFQKRDGTFLLVIWQGVKSCEQSPVNPIDIEPVPVMITLTLNGLTANVLNVYRPSFNAMPDGNGTTPVSIFKNISSLNLAIPDHVVVVSFSTKKTALASNNDNGLGCSRSDND